MSREMYLDRSRFEVRYGSFGVTGNYQQGCKLISASYAYKMGDGVLLIDTTAGEVVVTFPPVAEWFGGNLRTIIPISKIAGTNNVKIQLSGSDTFPNGNTFFNLGSENFNYNLYLLKLSTSSLNMYGLLDKLPIKAILSTDSALAAASFATIAVVPLDTVDKNTQTELFQTQVASSGAIASVTDNEDGTITLTDEDHGLSAGDQIIIAGTTSYNDSFTVESVTDDDNFVVTATYVADETGTWTRPARVICNVTGTVQASYTITIDSTGGAAWSADAGIYKNGTLVAVTALTASGQIGENKSMTLPVQEIDVEDGDYLELKLDNTTLTGNMTFASLSVSMVV